MPLFLLAAAGLAVSAYAAKSLADNAIKYIIIGGVVYFVAKNAKVI